MLYFLIIWSDWLKFRINNNAGLWCVGFWFSFFKNQANYKCIKIRIQIHLVFKLQCPVLAFGFLCLLSAFSQLWIFLLAIVTAQFRKWNMLRLHFGDLKFPDHITTTFMYAVAASPLAKQTRTGVGAGETNTEYRQKQVRQDCSAICGLRQCLSKGLLAPEIT